MVVDTRGLPCPQPVIQTKEALEKIGPGNTLIVLVDNEVSLENIKKFLNSQGHKVLKVEQKNSEYQLLIEKGSLDKTSPYEIVCPTAEPTAEKNFFLIIATHALGKDETLGETLMKGFLETLLYSNELPEWIFFLNTGVRLTTTIDYAVDLLTQLESKGVEIFSCGTCLKHYQLEDKLRVGKRGSTDILLSGMIEFRKVVCIG